MVISKKSLLHDTGWTFVGQGLGYGLRVGYFLIVAHLLGVVQYGVVVGAFAFVNLVAEQSRLGTGMLLLRYVSPQRRQFGAYWGNTLLVTTLTSAALIALLSILAPHILNPASASVVVILAITSCYLDQLVYSSTQAFMACGDMRGAAFINQLPSLLRFVVALAMWMTLQRATAMEWAFGSSLAGLLAALIALGLVSSQLGSPRFAPTLAVRHGLEGIGYACASSTTNAYNDLDKTMLSHFGMNAANGVYGLAYRIIDMATVPLMAVQLAAQPRLFQLADGGVLTLPVALGQRLLRRSLVLNAGICIGIVCLAPVIPMVVGHGFVDVVGALRWLCLILVFRCIHGITGCVLTGVGLQRFRTATQALVVGLNFGLNLWLIPRHGWHGAAWSSLVTDGTLAVLNWSVLQLRCRWMRGRGSEMCNSTVQSAVVSESQGADRASVSFSGPSTVR